jgi:hypothetical protein
MVHPEACLFSASAEFGGRVWMSGRNKGGTIVGPSEQPNSYLAVDGFGLLA